jgi:predicted transcriptional regulator
VKQIIISSPSDIWKDYGHLAGVTRSEFDNYFEGSSTACGIVMCKIHKVAPAPSLDELRLKSSSFHPPQFFKRMLPGDGALDLLRMRVAPVALTA